MAKFLLLLGCILQLTSLIRAQDSWKGAVFTEYNYFFSDERPKVMVQHSGESGELSIFLNGGRVVFKEKVDNGKQYHWDVLPIEKHEMSLMRDGQIDIPIHILWNGKILRDTIEIRTLTRKDNAVRIHFPSGNLETSLSTQPHFPQGDKRVHFFPFGFYARERDDFEWILRTEAMNGFNLYSPYQAIEDSTLPRRKAYMDLCAELGMRVNYNLQQVCALKKSDSPELRKSKLRRIEQEVRTFRDHPALLSWYVSDEPDGQFIAPDELAEAVALIRKLDPHHPISMVFVDPKPSLPYQDLLDIVMTDPYPIPGNSVVNAGEYLQKLKEFYQFKKHIWIVPQAFGGQEYWSREPTPNELKAMVYLGVIHGARASQAFIRHVGESFPKNPAMWSAYHESARELQYLTKDIQYQNEIKDFPSRDWWSKMKVDAACFKGENPNRKTFILVNYENEHKILNLPMDGEFAGPGEWNFVFENRTKKAGEVFEIVMNPFEVKVIQFEMPVVNINLIKEIEWKGNLIKDYSFENWTGVGIPTACYLHMSKDHGASAFLDRSIAHHGEVSLRLNNLGGNNAQDQSQEISFFQFPTVANHAYVLSFWAFAEQSSNRKVTENKIALRIEKPWGKFIWMDTVEVRSGWNRYDIPYVPMEGEDRNMLELRILQKGFVWIDQVQWVESPTISIQGEIFDAAQTMHAEVVGDMYPLNNIQYLYYPAGADTVLIANGAKDLLMEYPGSCQVQYPLPSGEMQKLVFPVRTKYKRINQLEYHIENSLKYPAGGKNALIDGVLGEFVWDGKWQGFEGADFEVDFEVSDVTARDIEIRSLSKKSAWVYWPSQVELLWSTDGVNFESIEKVLVPNQELSGPEGVKSFGFVLPTKCYAQINRPSHFKIKATNIQKLPADHPFVGEKSWLFIDEILVH